MVQIMSGLSPATLLLVVGLQVISAIPLKHLRPVPIFHPVPHPVPLPVPLPVPVPIRTSVPLSINAPISGAGIAIARGHAFPGGHWGHHGGHHGGHFGGGFGGGNFGGGGLGAGGEYGYYDEVNAYGDPLLGGGGGPNDFLIGQGGVPGKQNVNNHLVIVNKPELDNVNIGVGGGGGGHGHGYPGKDYYI